MDCRSEEEIALSCWQCRVRILHSYPELRETEVGNFFDRPPRKGQHLHSRFAVDPSTAEQIRHAPQDDHHYARCAHVVLSAPLRRDEGVAPPQIDPIRAAGQSVIMTISLPASTALSDIDFQYFLDALHQGPHHPVTLQRSRFPGLGQGPNIPEGRGPGHAVHVVPRARLASQESCWVVS